MLRWAFYQKFLELRVGALPSLRYSTGWGDVGMVDVVRVITGGPILFLTDA